MRTTKSQPWTSPYTASGPCHVEICLSRDGLGPWVDAVTICAVPKGEDIREVVIPEYRPLVERLMSSGKVRDRADTMPRILVQVARSGELAVIAKRSAIRTIGTR